MSLTVAHAMPRSVTGARQDDYPLAFWCLVFFTFIVFVAPQNAYGFLKPLHLAKAPAIVAIVAYAGQRLSRGASILPAGPEFRLLAVLVLLASLSIPFSLWLGGSVDLLVNFYSKSVIICILMAQVLTSVERFKQMLWFVVLFCFCASLVAINGYQQGARVEGYRMAGGWAGISANPNDFALTINLILPFAVTFFILTRNAVRKIVVATFLAVSVGAVLATYSRTGFLTMAAVLVLAMVKNVGQGHGLKYVLPTALIVFAGVSSMPADYGGRLESIVETSKDKVGSASARLASIHGSLEVIQEHPLLGVGLGMNNLALNDKGLYWAHVHNVYLQIAAEIGIAGLLVFLLLLRRLLKGLRQIQARFHGDPDHHDVALLAAACEISLLAFSIAAFFHPVAYHFYFYYLAGFALALKGIVERLPQEAAQPARLTRPWWPQAQAAGIATGA